MKSLSIAIALTISLLAGGCAKAPDPSSDPGPPAQTGAVATAAPRASPASGIAWFDGDVEQAFAHAKKEGKPLFLYWGAAWCPPCHEVKATVFRSAAFIDRSKLFVPVQLDGDTEDAQRHGERFGVLGYPTMIVFSADGEEITRIPGGSDIQAYANVLDLTLSNSRTASAVVAEVLDGEAAALDASDCALLAYYSWGQDTSLLEERDRAASFHRMYAACPRAAAAPRAALYLNYLEAAIDAADDAHAALAQAQKSQALAVIEDVLADYALVKANIYAVLFEGATMTGALTQAGSAERSRLVATYLDVLERIAADEDVFATERVYAYYGKMQFERIDDPEAALSAGLVGEIKAAVERADAATPDPYARQSVINASSNVLLEAGLDDDARTLLLKELGISKQPYYFMVSLADIEQEAGNYPDAIGWFKRAYDESTGPATRFQWGAYYVTALIEMVPEEVDLITGAAVGLIDELGRTRAFYQRPKRQLERLEKALQDWNGEGRYVAAIDAIRTRAQSICAQIPTDESARATCDAFLTG